MDKRATECLNSIGEAFKTLTTSADSEVELIGLLFEVMRDYQKVFDEAMTEGIRELEKRKKEN